MLMVYSENELLCLTIGVSTVLFLVISNYFVIETQNTQSP